MPPKTPVKRSMSAYPLFAGSEPPLPSLRTLHRIRHQPEPVVNMSGENSSSIQPIKLTAISKRTSSNGHDTTSLGPKSTTQAGQPSSTNKRVCHGLDEVVVVSSSSRASIAPRVKLRKTKRAINLGYIFSGSQHHLDHET
jgi:hypothetical protein